MAHKLKDIRQGPPRELKPVTPKVIDRLKRLDRFCEQLTNSDRDDPSAELLELAARYTDREITFDQFQQSYWQTRPISERLEETWRLSEQAYAKPPEDDNA